MRDMFSGCKSLTDLAMSGFGAGNNSDGSGGDTSSSLGIPMFERERPCFACFGAGVGGYVWRNCAHCRICMGRGEVNDWSC